MEYLYRYASPVGELLLASSGSHITGLWMQGQKYFASTLDSSHEFHELPIFEEARSWLDLYFSGENPGPPPPLAPKGSVFRQKVWKLLLEIPYGATATYKEIGLKIAHADTSTAMSAQAVGGAVGHNPISILIPCHRVVATDGNLTGYADGVEIKRRLLLLEKADVTGLYTPSK